MNPMYKMSLIFLLVIIGMGVLLKWSIGAWQHEKQERERIYSAFQSSQAVLQKIETLDGKIAAQSNVLQLQAKELKDLYPALQLEIQNLKIKPSRVEQVSQTGFSTEKHITTLLRDSLISDTVKVKTFDYTDEFYTVKGIAMNDTQQVDIWTRDSLLQVVYRGKRKHPLLWIFSKRQLEQRVALKNPNATIDYARVIQVVR